VPNNPGAHALFVDHQRVQYTEEIATGARRLMLAEARNATNLTSYQEPIRRKCHELTRGNWGRDYRRDLEVYNTLLEQFRTTCQGPIAMNVANVGQLETRLRAAFEGGAHPAGSDPVQAAMQAAYDVEHARAQQALAELAAEDGGAGGDDGGRGTKRRDRDDAPGGGGGSTTGGGPGGGGAETHKRPRLTSTGGGNDAAAS
jgi:hypothetical protein